MVKGNFRGISLNKELVGAVEEYIKARPEMGYRSLADFVTDALRKECGRLGILSLMQIPTLECFNLNENGVCILDRTLADKSSSGKIVNLSFKPEGLWCTHCQTSNCRHIRFAWNVPSIQKAALANHSSPRGKTT